ncbi:MAG: acetyl-CoA carboxylase biotin carboxylase subunit [Anaerolineae bacterium]
MKLRKCLIANRGEIAVRIISACRELGIQTVAVYSEVDAQAQHVKLADEAYLLGPAIPSLSYLFYPKLITVALDAGCDCVHPGYGFLSERADFAAAVQAAGLVWIGPRAYAIAKMGNKTEARALMEQAGVPVVPGFQIERASDADYLAAAEAIGYPVMVKAAGGGGGKGIRIVREARQMIEALDSARREAHNAFSDSRVFLEKHIEYGHHIEIQVVADQQGNIVHLFERECSSQRRHQKIIEESPSPLLDEHTRQKMGTAAVEAARAVGYINVGTVEFIVTPTGDFYFLEMNTRLQVEHPVTELVTGIDLVKLQFSIAEGEALPFTQADVSQRGHAIESRLYAEDPMNNFLPSIGRLLTFVPPIGPGVRVDSGVAVGDEISMFYDPMIAKVIVHAEDRQAAVARMQAALEQTVVLGVHTNLAFLQTLLAYPDFQSGKVYTRTIDEHLNELLPTPIPVSDTALIATALADYHREADAPLKSGFAGEGHVSTPWARADGFRSGR